MPEGGKEKTHLIAGIMVLKERHEQTKEEDERVML